MIGFMMKLVILGMLVMIVLITGCSSTPIESDPIPIGTVESTPTLDPTQFAAERYPAAWCVISMGTEC